MKHLLIALITASSIVAGAIAADPTTHTYEGTVTGVVCVSCKEHITAALTQKLPGTVRVDVKAGDKPEAQKLTIVSTNDTVTKESASAALGSFAKAYKILSLAKKD